MSMLGREDTLRAHEPSAPGQPFDRPSAPASSGVDRRDVDLAHRHHRREGALRLGAAGGEGQSERARRDLPRCTSSMRCRLWSCASAALAVRSQARQCALVDGLPSSKSTRCTKRSSNGSIVSRDTAAGPRACRRACNGREREPESGCVQAHGRDDVTLSASRGRRRSRTYRARLSAPLALSGGQ